MTWLMAVFLFHSVAFPQSRGQRAVAVLSAHSDEITGAAEMFGVHSRLVAGVIFVEQVMNVSWVDRALDATFAEYGFNTSVGLGQVKVLTAEWIENTLKDSVSPYFLGNSYSGVFPLSESRKELAARLDRPEWNARYVAANLAMIRKRWLDAGVSLNDRGDILGTLYSTGVHDNGVEKKIPHPHPVPNQFGRFTQKFFDSDLLKNLFPR